MPPSLRRRWFCLSLIAPAGLSACSADTSRAAPLPPGSTVLALGDSLTAGYGAQSGEDWPSLLRSSTGWDVVNAGISGNTSTQGLERLPSLLQEHHPQLVIIGLGGNDFLRRIPSSTTAHALTQAIEMVRASNAHVVLVAIPQPSLMAAAGATPGDHPLYAQVAKATDTPLIEGIWGSILGDARLRSDQVHANAQGYAAFAQALEAALRHQGFLH